MKNKFLIISSLLILLLLSFSIAAAQSEKIKVLDSSNTVIHALKRKDMKTVATLAHPIKGIRFSPYGYINKKDDLVFRGSALSSLLNSQKVYRWGMYDESEQPIRMTFAKYYNEFVYDYDFVKPDQINYNLKQNNGIMINNIAETYPKGIEVEYFIDGTDSRMYGSLRLIFEKLKAKWYLVGIVRDTPGI